MDRLTNRVAFITGAGSGLGRAMATRFAEEGADIGCADINLRGAEETADMVRALGRRAVVVGCDVRKQAELEAGVAATVAALGDLWVAVANAGINRSGTLLTLTEADWQAVIDINLTGVFLTCQTAARQLVAQGKGGRLICIASVAAEKGFAGLIPYGAAKAGVRHMTRSMAQELAPHRITANSIGPGLIATPFGGGDWSAPGRREAAGAGIPLGRVGEAADVAAVAAFLASDDASFVTGSYYLVDGGMTDAGFGGAGAQR
ncbi:MAG: SDR family NAD(P)-dependent oxidoreductase [Dehalococcoidia bacterium]